MNAKTINSLQKRIKNINNTITNAELVDNLLDSFNSELSGYGIEAIRCDTVWDSYYCDICALYVNMGDTYASTILYDTVKGKFYITTFGDFVEKNERKYGII